MTVAFVLGGGGQLGAHEVGMLRALLERGIVARPRRRHVGRRDQRRRGRERADASRRSSGSPSTWADIERSDVFAGSLLRRLGDARAHRHAPARQRRAAGDAHRGAADRADRGPAGALRVRRGEHRGRGRALVHGRPARRRGARLGGRAGDPAAGRGRRRALHRRRDRQLDPGRPRGRSSARRGSSSCTSAASTGRWSRRAGRGRSRSWPSRSRAGTASSATSRRCRTPSSVHVLPDRPARAAALQRPLGAALPRHRATWGRASSARTRPRCAYLEERGL